MQNQAPYTGGNIQISGSAMSGSGTTPGGHNPAKRIDSQPYSSIYSDTEKLGATKYPLIDNKNPYGN